MFIWLATCCPLGFLYGALQKHILKSNKQSQGKGKKDTDPINEVNHKPIDRSTSSNENKDKKRKSNYACIVIVVIIIIYEEDY